MPIVLDRTCDTGLRDISGFAHRVRTSNNSEREARGPAEELSSCASNFENLPARALTFCEELGKSGYEQVFGLPYLYGSSVPPAGARRVMSAKIVVTINSSGRQAASFIRCASAIGWNVRAQMKDGNGIVAEDIMSRDNVEVVLGSLSNPRVIEELFEGGADLAFINTTHWGDEVAIGKALADAAERAGVQHLIYSSMPDHSVFNRGWRALPLWASKFTVENYIRQIGIPATFVYCGIYHNNFTSLPYPLFRMELQDDGSFVWQAPFDRNQKLPWLDAEQDVGPAILTLFQQGPRKWAGKR